MSEDRIQRIAAEVCQKHGVTLDLLRSDLRTTGLVHARWEIMERLDREVCVNLSAIGRFLNRDRATVRHGVRRQQKRTYRKTTALMAPISPLG